MIRNSGLAVSGAGVRWSGPQQQEPLDDVDLIKRLTEAFRHQPLAIMTIIFFFVCLLVCIRKTHSIDYGVGFIYFYIPM